MLRPCEYNKGTYLERLPLDVHCELIRYLWVYDIKVDRESSCVRMIIKSFGTASSVNFRRETKRKDLLKFIDDISRAEYKRLHDGDISRVD